MSCVKHRRNVSVDLEQTVDPNFQDMILPVTFQNQISESCFLKKKGLHTELK